MLKVLPNLVFALKLGEVIEQRFKSDKKSNKIKIIQEIMCNIAFERYNDLAINYHLLGDKKEKDFIPYKDEVDFLARSFNIKYIEMKNIVDSLKPFKDDKIDCKNKTLDIKLSAYEFNKN